MNSQLQTLFSALDQERIALEQKLSSLDNNALNEPMEPGKWSALQTLRHLIMAEGSSVAYMRKKLEHGVKAEKAGLGTRLRAGLLIGWFKLGLKAKAPTAYAQIPSPQDRNTIFEDYARVRSEMKELLESVPDEWVEKELFKHPAAGKIKLSSALQFLQAHFRHHEKQISAKLRV